MAAALLKRTAYQSTLFVPSERATLGIVQRKKFKILKDELLMNHLNIHYSVCLYSYVPKSYELLKYALENNDKVLVCGGSSLDAVQAHMSVYGSLETEVCWPCSFATKADMTPNVLLIENKGQHIKKNLSLLNLHRVKLIHIADDDIGTIDLLERAL